MYTKINSQSSLDLVTLSEVKLQLRLTNSFTMDDAYIAGLISASGELAQTYTNRMLSLGSVSQMWETYESEYKLWGGNVTTITSVTGEKPESGEVVEITDYRFNELSQKLTIAPESRNLINITATYQAGYTATPTKVKQGILMMIATFYNNREDFLVGQTHEKLPFTSTILLDSVRVPYAS